MSQGLSRGRPQLSKGQTCRGLLSASVGPLHALSEPALSVRAHRVPCTPVLYTCQVGLCEACVQLACDMECLDAA